MEFSPAARPPAEKSELFFHNAIIRIKLSLPPFLGNVHFIGTRLSRISDQTAITGRGHWPMALADGTGRGRPPGTSAFAMVARSLVSFLADDRINGHSGNIGWTRFCVSDAPKSNKTTDLQES